MFDFIRKKKENEKLFMSEKEYKKYSAQYVEPEPTDLSLPSPNMIMSQHFKRPINQRKIIGNGNVVVVSDYASDDSKAFVKSNILQMNASYVITDPLGNLAYTLGNTLKDNGYVIKILNLSDMEHSNMYNPLVYVNDEASVFDLVNSFIINTRMKGSKPDLFFENCERSLLFSCVFYLINHCEDETKRNFSSLIDMLNASAVDENNPNAKSDLDELFDALPKDSLAWRSYAKFKQAAGKSLKSIVISCVTRLQPFLIPQVANLTRIDSLDLSRINDEKTALFIITPGASCTCSFLVPILYHQLFNTLYYKWEKEHFTKGYEELYQSKLHVRCIMNDFANIGEIVEFPMKLATMRMYNISATILLQNASQIESVYKEDWLSIFGNCSSIVFFGTQDPMTLNYLSKKVKMDDLINIPTGKCIVFTQSMQPLCDECFQYESHPRYQCTADANSELGFKYNETHDCLKFRKEESGEKEVSF